MSAPTGDVDQARADRRQDRWAWAVPPLATGYVAALVVAQGGTWPGLLGPLGGGLVSLALVVSSVATWAARRPGSRDRAIAAARVQRAVRAGVDPGPGLRERADRQARHLAGMGWAAPFFLVVPLVFVDSAPWDRPALAGAALAVLVVAFVVVAVSTLRAARSAQRWLADPPGPARPMPPPAPWQRWAAAASLVGGVCILAGSLLGRIAD